MGTRLVPQVLSLHDYDRKARVPSMQRPQEVGLICTIVSKLHRKLGKDAHNPIYTFTKHCVGYRMAKGEPR